MAQPEPTTMVFTVHGPIARTDLPGLCDRVCRLLNESDAEVAVCEVDPLVAPDAVTVDALCRLELAARRLGRHVRLRNASRELQQLLAFIGLGDVQPFESGLRVEPGQETEEREQVRRVEEERQLGDPAL